MAKEESVAFSDREREAIEAVAAERGISFEEAANELAREGLARRVKKKTRRSPSSNVQRFRR